MIARFFIFFALAPMYGLSTQVLASDMAKVIRLRGYATQLSPGARDARIVELGQKIYEDTSILTKEKSFVVLEFSDGSRMSVGPQSKVVVVKARGSDPGLISLLKGKIRNTVKPEDSNEDKYIIRTRTAALGVRGTDFQTSYNTENKATALVTFKGRVAMVRLDSSAEDLEVALDKNITIERDEKGEPTVDSAIEGQRTRIEVLQQKLRSADSVSVENGQYSGAVTGLVKPTQPVVINPTQLALMYKNDQLSPKKENEKIEKIDFSNITHKGNADSSYNAKTGEFSPRAGGFVDLDTALYIPPKEDSVLDTKRNIYVPKDVGFVNRDTGDYIPPKGLLLDPKNGFVAQASSGVQIAQAGAMNKTMAKDVLLKDIKDEIPVIRPNKRERINRGMVSLAFGPSGETHTIENDTLGSNFKNDSEGGVSFLLSHDHAGKNEWQAITRLGLRFVDLSKENNINSKSDSLWSIGAGARHALSPRLAISGTLSLEQTFIYNHPQESTFTVNEWTRFTIPTFDFTLESEFLRTNRFAMIGDLGLLIALPKSKADVDSKLGLGFHARVGAEYWTSRRMTLGLNFFTKQQSFKLESSRFNSEDRHSEGGVQLRVQYFY